MDLPFDIVVWFGDQVLALVERFSGWRPDAKNRERLQYIAAGFSVIGGVFVIFRAWKSLLRFFGRGHKLTPDEQVLADAVARQTRAQLAPDIEALRLALAAREAGPVTPSGASPPTISSSPGDGLSRDLDAAIETLLAAGKADALKDKTGQAAETALDQLIAERARARERVAKDEAALWRQKGALSFLHDTHAARAAYARATELDPDDAEGWNQFGHLESRLGNLDAATVAYERVLALGNQVDEKSTIAAATGNLGILYTTRGDLDRAEDMYRKALALNEALGRKEGMANQYGNLGRLEEQRGNLAAACAHWTEARDLFRRIGSPNAILIEGWMREAGCFTK